MRGSLELTRPIRLQEAVRWLPVAGLLVAMLAVALMVVVPDADAAKPQYVLCELDDGEIVKVPVPLVARNGREGTVGDAVRLCIGRYGGRPAGVGP